MRLFSLALLLLSSPLYSGTPQDNQQTIQSRFKDEETKSEEMIYFTPPLGWYVVTPEMVAESAEKSPLVSKFAQQLPKSVRFMVVGKGQGIFPPNMNLTTQYYAGTLKEYLKMIKAINDSQGYDWKDLGTIKTPSGNASISQVDNKTEWGSVRYMRLILLKDKTIYMLTASAIASEFSQYYNEFFKSMKSLTVNKNPVDMIKSKDKQREYKQIYEKLQSKWSAAFAQKKQQEPEKETHELKQQVFESAEFQKNGWTPFKQAIAEKFSDMGAEWQSFVFEKTESGLLD